MLFNHLMVKKGRTKDVACNELTIVTNALILEYEDFEKRDKSALSEKQVNEYRDTLYTALLECMVEMETEQLRYDEHSTEYQFYEQLINHLENEYGI